MLVAPPDTIVGRPESDRGRAESSDRSRPPPAVRAADPARAARDWRSPPRSPDRASARGDPPHDSMSSADRAPAPPATPALWADRAAKMRPGSSPGVGGSRPSLRIALGMKNLNLRHDLDLVTDHDAANVEVLIPVQPERLAVDHAPRGVEGPLSAT